MNVSDKGWLKKYMDYRSTVTMSSEKVTLFSTDQRLYKYLQPTGLMYGYPLNIPNVHVSEIKTWSNKDKMKILLTESLLQSGTFFTDQKAALGEKDILSGITDYYQRFYPEAVKKPGWKAKKLFKSETGMAEYVINHRIGFKSSLSKGFWSSFFENSLLFLDVYYYGKWASLSTIITSESMHQEQADMRLAILKVIAAAAQSNGTIEKEERQLFEFFLKSADLQEAQEKEARLLIDGKVSFEEIDFPDINNWILKKYMLELAILTTLSDKVMEDSEKEFIRKLGDRISIPDEEMEASMIAIESFVVGNWDNLHYIHANKSFKMVSQRLYKSLSVAVGKNKESITQEIRESKELFHLLGKSKETELSPAEKEKVRAQLIDILKTIPTFVIIALPFSFLTLPVLFKLLPKGAFPSSFQDN